MELPFDRAFLKAEENNECFKEKTVFTRSVHENGLRVGAVTYVQQSLFVLTDLLKNKLRQ